MDPAPSPMPAPPTPPPAAASSLGTRLMNMFVTPGEVFDEVRSGPASPAHWLVPVLLTCLVGVISVWVIFSQKPILHQIREQTERAMAKKLEKLPQEERDKAMQALEKFSNPLLLKLAGSLGAVVGPFIQLFGIALVLWTVGRVVLGARFPYMQAMEVSGLAGMIQVLGGIVGTLLVVGFGAMTATPGPALFIREFDPSNRLHQMAAACNVMTLWYTGVLSVGLGRLSGVSAWKAFACLFALWASLRAAVILSGLGERGM